MCLLVIPFLFCFSLKAKSDECDLNSKWQDKKNFLYKSFHFFSESKRLTRLLTVNHV